VGDDLAAEDLAGTGETLCMVHVGMGGDDQLARREAEIHLPDQLQHVGEFIQESHVDEGKFGAAVDEVDVHPHPAPRLVVHLQYARKDITPLDHAENGPSKEILRLVRPPGRLAILRS
jgi:hypothetical protein